jgi:hypothetical protein
MICFVVVVIRSTIGNKPSEILVQTGVIGKDGRWPLAATLLFGSRLAVLWGGGKQKDQRKTKEKKTKRLSVYWE